MAKTVTEEFVKNPTQQNIGAIAKLEEEALAKSSANVLAWT